MSTLKPTSIRPVLGFGTLSDGDLVARATAVIKGMTGNAAFPSPPVELTAFNTAVNAYSAAIAAALDGGKNAKAARDNQRKIVIQDLRLLAVYVEKNSNNDMAIFSSSGFVAKANAKTAPQPVATPTIRKLDYGANSGQLVVSIKSVPGARSYSLRYAALAGTTPGAWTTLPVATIQKPVTVGNLTPGTTYAFEVQALGSQGYSDWSDSSTCMCT